MTQGGESMDTAIGNVEGRAYWKENGQTPAAFLAECMQLYQVRTGQRPALAICHPGQVAGLQGHGVEVRSARVNMRLVILTGGSEHAE